jgi:hypothetical protein
LITAEIDTFISEVSTTRTNIAADNRSASRGLPLFSSLTASSGAVLMEAASLHRAA